MARKISRDGVTLEGFIVWVNDVAIPLTHTESLVFSYLLRGVNLPVHAQAIEDAIWVDKPPLDNFNLRTAKHVSHLRRKLRGHCRILTCPSPKHWGASYVLITDSEIGDRLEGVGCLDW